MFNYIKTRGYGWETLALTWEEGTATVTGDTLTLKPTTGKYKVIDNRVAKNSYERPMTLEEIKKNLKTRTWSRETDPAPVACPEDGGYHLQARRVTQKRVEWYHRHR